MSSNKIVCLKLVDNITGPLKKTQTQLKGFQASVKGLGSSLGGLTSVLAVGGIVAGVKTLMDAVDDQAQSNLKLSQSIYTYGKTLGMTQKEIDDAYNDIAKTAGEIQSHSVFGDEALQEAMAYALTTGLNVKQTQRLADASSDLTSRMKGAKATNEDLIATNKTLSDAIEKGNVKAIESLGIKFTDEEAKAFKAMTTSERFALVCDRVDQHAKGAGQSVRDTFGGALAGIKGNIGDITQEIGRLLFGFNDLNGTIPVIKQIDMYLESLKNRLTQVNSIGEGIKMVFNDFYQYSPLLATIVTVVANLAIGFMAVSKAIAICNAGVALFNAIGAIPGPILAIGVIIALISALIVNWDMVCQAVENFKAGFLSAFDAIAEKVDWVIGKIKEFATMIANGSPIGLAYRAITGRALVEPTGGSWSGTDYVPQGWRVVGEHGPELVNFRQGGGQVLNNRDTQKAMGGGQALNISVNIQGNVIGNEEFADDIGNTIFNKIQLAYGNM